MTSGEERQLKADLLLEYEETAAQLRLAEGRIKDYGRGLASVARSMEHGILDPGELDTLRALAARINELADFTALRERVQELSRRKTRLFGDSRL